MAAEEIEISDDEMDGGDDMEREDQMDLEALKHARTLRLDDFAEPDTTDKAHTAVPEPAPQVDPAAIEAQIWKQRYEEMAEKLAAIEKQRTSDSLHTPTPKKLFSSPAPKAPEGIASWWTGFPTCEGIAAFGSATTCGKGRIAQAICCKVSAVPSEPSEPESEL